MLKNKYYLISFEILCALALIVGCFWFFNNNRNNSKITRRDANVVSENWLQVAEGNISSDLKQLSLSNNSTNKESDSENAGSSPLDPTTFGEYEKYKDDKAAMFGEIQIGTGAEITINKKAAVAYKLWLTDGKLVEMSPTDENGQVQPFIFTLGAREVIVGLEQAMTGMKAGGTRLIIVPPAVGYGVAGTDTIPGNAVLVFQVQLITVQ